jgi:lysylphosphatidylglycerol synthetase-like protein (DUF2156 family)
LLHFFIAYFTQVSLKRAFHELFHRPCPWKRQVWQPRYLASPGGLALPQILANLAALVSGGLKGAVSK